jgi:DNA-binding CsgD family transcriptional regulator
MSALTPRDVFVIDCVSRGASDAEIAAQIFRSPRRTGNLVREILGKLGALNRPHAVGIYLRGDYETVSESALPLLDSRQRMPHRAGADGGGRLPPQGDDLRR